MERGSAVEEELMEVEGELESKNKFSVGETETCYQRFLLVTMTKQVTLATGNYGTRIPFMQ